MESQVTNNANALRLFFTEDVFLVEDKDVKIDAEVAYEGVSDKFTPLKQAADNNKISVLKDETPVIVENEYIENAEIPLISEEPKPKPDFKYLGGNKKFVLILVNDKNYDVSSEQGRELLRKIVKAIDLSTPDFALLNYANHLETDYAELQQFFKPQLVLAFGVETNHLNLNLVWANEILIHESTKMIFAPNLHDLDSNLTEKKALWSHLQKIK
ncbi:hypothetical protein ACFOWA_17385 [Pedobacter lithocola]|uniref:DNA polymerase III subunit psi n=1 Tax=Pedobacter lithocola TaxID=1908239 RepID=A0ABV8PG46_9SPHI